MTIRALVFDFDGLIIDSETPELEAWQETFRRYDCELTLEVWIDCVGRPPGSFDPCEHLGELYGGELDREAIREQTRSRTREIVFSQPALPGVENLLRAARQRGLKTGLASSSRHNWVEGHLERLGLLDCFDAIVCSEDTERHKPEPEPFLVVARALGVEPSEAIAFEDSAHGLTAANRAGMVAIAVPNPVTRHLHLEQAHLRLDSLDELTLDDLIARFERG